MQVGMKGDKLVIIIDTTQDQGLSSTGRSTIVETTAGWHKVEGTDLVFNLNVVRPSVARQQRVAARVARVLNQPKPQRKRKAA